jgi:Arc/MetJ-type ribon-helix-helix transcriptional regulator
VKIELTPDAAHWVEAEIAAGTFVTPEDAVRYAINQAKMAALRAKLDAAVAAGGDNSADDVRNFVRQSLDTLNQTPKAS